VPYAIIAVPNPEIPRLAPVAVPTPDTMLPY